MKLSKNLKRLAVSLFAVWLAFGPVTMISFALAEDETGGAFIETGPVDIVVVADTEVNQNHTELGESEPIAVSADDTSVPSEPEAVSSPEGLSPPAEGGEDVLVVESENQATTTNAVDTAGDSGGNQAGVSNRADITTGDVSDTNYLMTQVNGNWVISTCPGGCGTPAVDSSNDNAATSVNAVATDASSGENSITEAGEAGIKTGDVNILNAIVNYINANFTGSGQDHFINLFADIYGSLDLTEYQEYGASVIELGNLNCGELGCLVEADNENRGTIVNDLDVLGKSGANEISSSGASIIETGDISIINDIANVANINVAGHDWFFAVVNIFGILEGDIILPTLYRPDQTVAPESVDSTLDAAQTGSAFLVTNEDKAAVLNDIAATGNAGGNLAETSGTATIKTGSADVSLKNMNFVNLSFTGDRWVFTRINVFGNWTGSVFGLPEGFHWSSDGNGFTIIGEKFDIGTFRAGINAIAAKNDNAAEVTNRIRVVGDSGDNRILNGNDMSLIDTGDVDIENNLLNFINANFTGNAWQFAMINVFGDWQGDLAYGQPDLWLVSTPLAVGPLDRGAPVTYQVMFGNKGDSTARHVKIKKAIDHNYLWGPNDRNADEVIFDLGDLAPNSQGSLTYTVKVSEDVPFGPSETTFQAIIDGDGGDRNNIDNSLTGNVTIDGGRSRESRAMFAAAVNGGGGSGGSVVPGSLSITKTNDATSTVKTGDIVNFEVSVRNTGAVGLDRVRLLDLMYDEASRPYSQDLWDIGDLSIGEQVVVKYSIVISDNLPAGIYTNQAFAEGYDPAGGLAKAVASSKINVEASAMTLPVAVLAETAIPNLALSLSASRDTLAPGQSAKGTLVIANNGNVSLFNVDIRALLPDELTLGNEKTKIVDWNFSEIAPAEIIKLEFPLDADNSAANGVYAVSATAQAENHQEVRGTMAIKVRSAIAVAAAVGGGEIDLDALPATGFVPREAWLIVFAALFLFLSGFAMLQMGGSDRYDGK